MQKIYKAFKELENHINKPSEFLSKLSEIIESEGIDCALKALKATGISVDAFNTGKNITLYNEAIDLVECSDFVMKSNVCKFKEQSTIINALFYDFYSKDEFNHLK